MHRLATVLKALSPIFFIVAALHVSLGLGADMLLGAQVPPSVAADPALDSQNRFYGMAFALYGVVLCLCATDLPRFAPVFGATLVVFFLGGVARLISWALHGAPPALIVVLTAVELIAPPALWIWFRRVKHRA